MSRKQRRKNLYFRPVEELLLNQKLNTGNEQSAWLPWNYSPPNPKVEGVIEKDLSSISIDYQLTVCPKVELTRYQCSMLLETLEVQIVESGVSFSNYLCLEYLFSRLLGTKEILELRSENERRTVFLAQILLRAIRGTWFSLDSKEKILQDTVDKMKEIHNLFPSLREFRSRAEYWNCERFLRVQAVRLDVFLERRKDSNRYSSYCKGYGESSHMGHRQKTRPSVELDGEETDRPEVYISSLSELQLLLDLVILDIHEQASKETEKR
jgi:hypothetical protein